MKAQGSRGDFMPRLEQVGHHPGLHGRWLIFSTKTATVVPGDSGTSPTPTDTSPVTAFKEATCEPLTPRTQAARR